MTIFLAVVFGILSVIGAFYFTFSFNSNTQVGVVVGIGLATVLHRYFHVGSLTSLLIFFVVMNIVIMAMTYRGNKVKQEMSRKLQNQRHQ